MLYFASDYQEGAHPAIMERLAETNLDRTPGYGTDEICESARNRIRTYCACPGAAVYFLSGGTQANATVITASLSPWQGIISADTGHISTHEAGAIEAGGHKVLTLPHSTGKITAAAVSSLCEAWEQDANHDHMVMPGMVYLSQPTEYGTLYSLDELKSMRRVCDRFGLKLYVDGARLAYALAAEGQVPSLADLARMCDVFYIGGTKCGALLGEAVVIPDPSLLPHFFTIIKQRGALLAKGRILGIQFDELFRNDLYLKIGKNAVKRAQRLQKAFTDAGFKLEFESPTNQVFPIIEDEKLSLLERSLTYSFWEKKNRTHTVIRLAAGWSTTDDEVRELEELLRGF